MEVIERTKEEKELFAQKAKMIYDQLYKETLEQTSKGKIAAIEVESEECFVGDSVLEVYNKGKKKYFNKYFFYFKIGYPGFKRRRR